jgi:hypothetical protein
MIYGMALVIAHQKAEAMSWAGCVLDKSAIDYAKSLGNIDNLLDEHTMLYDVPYEAKKEGVEVEVRVKERALTLRKKITIPKYIEDSIRSAFKSDRKGEIEGRVEVMFNNTIEFLRAHCRFPFYYKADKSTNSKSIFVFGKLDADYTHTAVIREEERNQHITFSINTIKMVLENNPDMGFIDEQEIMSEEFEEQLSSTLTG